MYMEIWWENILENYYYEDRQEMIVLPEDRMSVNFVNTE
jgi:hypothetical protein